MSMVFKKTVIMTTLQRKVQCVLWLAKFDSVTLVQREYRRVFHEDPPARCNIYRWDKTFKETGSLLNKKRSGRPRTSDETVENVRNCFLRSPKKSVRRCSRELNVSKSTVFKVLKRNLNFRGYKLQLLHALNPDDKLKRYNFSVDLLNENELDQNFINRIMFSDEATFHISGCVNRHNVRIWGSENPHAFLEHQRDSPKVNVWCALSRDRVIGPFFFSEKTINRFIYLDMLEIFAVPQIENENVIFQQDGAPPHYATVVRDFLNERFPQRWIGRGGWKAWPPRSPDLTPLDFFLWGFVKTQVYSEKIRDIEHLKQRIRDAVESVTPEILLHVWQEIEFRLDVCRATNGSHVELR